MPYMDGKVQKDIDVTITRILCISIVYIIAKC